jgi:hypothetical protein
VAGPDIFDVIIFTVDSLQKDKTYVNISMSTVIG